jgi:acetyl-CoA decarbonylase/synthase complex subunit epsilon
MSLKAEPWQTAEIAGPKKAFLILKPDVVVAIVKRAKRPLLVVGHMAGEAGSEYDNLIKYAIQMNRVAGVPVVATANTVKAFLQAGFQPTAHMSAMDIGNRLQDASWMGLDGLGPYDLALFTGLPYYMEFVILSALKHFSPNLTTMSLSRYYTPHATWSFPNLKIADWRESFEIILNKLKGT